MRAVARRLLSDEGFAEDVVQETLLRAVQRGPRPTPRSWMARVCRNLSIDRLRGESRRSRREREASRPEHVSATHELADRLERHRMVADAVLGLEPLFRDVILLRFYEDMPPRQMAEVLDGKEPAAASVRAPAGTTEALPRGKLDGRNHAAPRPAP